MLALDLLHLWARLTGRFEMAVLPRCGSGSSDVVVIDLTTVTFIGVAGVNCFVQAGDRLRSDGRGLVSQAHRIQVADSAREATSDTPYYRCSIQPDRRRSQQVGFVTIAADTSTSATMGPYDRPMTGARQHAPAPLPAGSDSLTGDRTLH